MSTALTFNGTTLRVPNNYPNSRLRAIIFSYSSNSRKPPAAYMISILSLLDKLGLGDRL